MAPVTTKTIVAAALASNAVCAVGKILAYALTGSSALLSEAIHSLVAITHQILLLFGIGQSQRPADARHAFGYARELYFWSFIAAILLFSHGAGVAIYEGIQKLKTPPFLSIAPISYAALGVAIALQVAVAVFLLKDRGVVSALAAPRDPVRAVLGIETLAALAGLLFALGGLIATDVFGLRYGDAMASLGIGFVMAAVAAVLCLRIKSLIVGEAASPALRSRLRGLLHAETGPGNPLAAVHEIRTLHLGPDDLLVAAYVQFKDGQTARSVEETTARLKHSISGYAPEVRHVFIAVQPPDANEFVREDEPEAYEEPEREAVAPELKDGLDVVLSQPHAPVGAPASPKQAQPSRPSTNGNRKTRKKKRRH
ncbi:MAG: cation diffusion facilitator family transporter [Hyphomicrobiaceae bacterium]|nr:cation diffusion facilitator family transporter [Hyphomicrobiaceae bacterium]